MNGANHIDLRGAGMDRVALDPLVERLAATPLRVERHPLDDRAQAAVEGRATLLPISSRQLPTTVEWE